MPTTELNQIYRERNNLVLYLASLVIFYGGKAGLKKNLVNEDYIILYIDLPDGKGGSFEASWHIKKSELGVFHDLFPEYQKEWDGHETPEKYRRLNKASISLLTRAP